MLVKHWMNTLVFSIDADASLQKAINLQKECKVNTLPVMDNQKLVGIITDRDIKRASVSDKMPLDINEAISLASEIKVRDVMTPHPVTIPYEYTMQEAAEILLNNKISGAPVMDNDGKMIGIINRSDALKVLISLTGSDKKGYLFAFSVEDQAGNIGKIVKIMRDFGCRIASILGSYEKAPLNHRNVYIRVYDLESEKYTELLQKLKETLRVRYVVDFITNKREIFEE